MFRRQPLATAGLVLAGWLSAYSAIAAQEPLADDILSEEAIARIRAAAARPEPGIFTGAARATFYGTAEVPRYSPAYYVPESRVWIDEGGIDVLSLLTKAGPLFSGSATSAGSDRFASRFNANSPHSKRPRVDLQTRAVIRNQHRDPQSNWPLGGVGTGRFRIVSPPPRRLVMT
jgi:hypothetical protein